MKSRSNIIFVVFSLVLLIALLETNWFFKEYFGEARELQTRVGVLNHDLERQKLKTALLQNQFLDFQQDVAKNLSPTEKKNLVNARAEASELSQVLRRPASEHLIDTSSVLMARAREQFKLAHYDRAVTLFREVIEKYPVSSQVVDAYFLLGESLFQSEQYEECLNVAYEMINHFPQNQMTGYLMLRNGQILSMRKRTQEASEVFQIVSEQFASNKELAEQARRMALGQ